MATKANITSVEAIEAFRANLIVYISKARPTLEEVNSELARTKNWVQSTQKGHYTGVMKQRGRALEEARAGLFSAKLSNFREAASAEQLALSKAKTAYDHAEQKMRMIRRWDRDFENKTEPLAKQLEKVHTILADDLAKAVHQLGNIVRLLNDYAGMKAPSILSEEEKASQESATEGVAGSSNDGVGEGGGAGGGSTDGGAA
jgi:uncharacterized protein YoxC